MPTNILAGLGVTTATYNPPLAEDERVVTIHHQTVFVPPLPSSNPLRLLLSERMDGQVVTSCGGPLREPNLHGTLQWSDGTQSSYTIDTVNAERVYGHLVARATGTINNGHYSGCEINKLGIRLAGQVAACLSGGTVSNSAGSSIVIVTDQ
jgi:hypothetical protein